MENKFMTPPTELVMAPGDTNPPMGQKVKI